MNVALSEAMKAELNNEIPVGAVIVHKGKVVSQHHNLVKKNIDPTAHAEILCIREVAQNLGSHHLDEHEIYITLEPCAMCIQAISFSRIKRVYFGAYDEKFGAIENGIRFFNTSSANHVPEVYGGIQQEKAIEILQGFFKKIRDSKKSVKDDLINKN